MGNDTGSVQIPEGTNDHDRLVTYEGELRLVNQRLNEGAATFGEIKKAIEVMAERWSEELSVIEHKRSEELAVLDQKINDQKPKPVSKLTMISSGFAIVLAIGGMVWTAARYPDRGEFKEIEKQVQSLDVANQLRVRDVEDIKSALGRIEVGLARVAPKP